MVLKVDNEELEQFTIRMNKSSEEFSKEIDNMLHQIEILRTIWQGTDATTFQDNVTEYLTKMKVLPKALSTLSSVTQKTNKSYAERDEAFGKKLSEVNTKYEQ